MSKYLYLMLLGAVASYAADTAVEWHCEYVNRVDQCHLVAVPVTQNEGE